MYKYMYNLNSVNIKQFIQSEKPKQESAENLSTLEIESDQVYVIMKWALHYKHYLYSVI